MLQAKNNTRDPDPKMPTVRTLICIFVVVFLIWCINWGWGTFFADDSDRGTFGDMFGASNALFSALALAGVIYAIFIQRSEVKIARSELHYTKSIFEETTRNLKLQNEETKLQIFENSFFQLLRVFTDLTNNLDLISSKGKITKGKDVLSAFESRLGRVESGLRTAQRRPPSYSAVFAKLYRARQNDLGHYFRMLYTILKFIDESEISNKKFYTNILRAQLSNSELHLLLYNGLSDNGRAKLKPLLEKYEFFDNLPIITVKYPNALQSYEKSAYGDNEPILQILSN